MMELYDYVFTFFVHSIIGSKNIDIEPFLVKGKYCFELEDQLKEELGEYCKEKSIIADRYYEVKVKVHKCEVDDLEYYHEFSDFKDLNDRKDIGDE